MGPLLVHSVGLYMSLYFVAMGRYWAPLLGPDVGALCWTMGPAVSVLLLDKQILGAILWAMLDHEPLCWIMSPLIEALIWTTGPSFFLLVLVLMKWHWQGL